MSLLSSIQMASNALQVTEIGLQVVGQNISNANTPGYVSEQVNLQPSPTQQYQGLLLGTGVQIQSITEQIDNFLEERLRNAQGDQAGADTVKQTYSQLEGVLGALGSNSLQSSMNTFFSSIAGILNQPEDESVRNMAVLQGQALAGNVNQLATQTDQLRSDVNTQIQDMAPTVNSLIQQVQSLNLQIEDAEGGSTSNSTAAGLDDQRRTALSNLAQLLGTTSVQNPDGTVSVYCGGEYLVSGGIARQVQVTQSTDRGMTVANLQVAGVQTPLDPTSGQLCGLLNSRDQVLGGFLDQLNSFAGTLAFEFNKVYSGGQGLTGFTQMTSTNQVDDPTQALNQAGLPSAPGSGSFQVLVQNTDTGDVQTSNVNVQLNGTVGDTTLDSLAASLSAINGLQATVTGGQLVVTTTDPDTEFSFSQDTSGVLASLGLNTFFTGSNASDLAVNQDVVNDPGKFAASSDGIGTDTGNATVLANFLDRPLSSAGGATISDLANNLTDDVTQASANAQAQSQGADTFTQTLQGEESSISGVSIDEQTVQMITLERSYQAEAKYISTLNDMLNDLMQM
ncbi:MAG: flagellar hook-associated protein FlgK [Thermoguttaceae bacterium]|jgi:flagellar hook-associated protein 1 FlgK